MVSLTFALVLGGILLTTTPIVTQSPSMSAPFVVLFWICEILTNLRPSILFSMTADDTSGELIKTKMIIINRDSIHIRKN